MYTHTQTHTYIYIYTYTYVDNEDPRGWLIQNFFTAFDALSDNNTILFQNGLEFSIKQQKCILSQVKMFTEQKLFVNTRHFRYVKTTLFNDIFANPLMLIRLAQFLCMYTYIMYVYMYIFSECMYSLCVCD